MLGDNTRNANVYRVRYLSRDTACFANALHLGNLTVNRVRNLTAASFANHSSRANGNLASFGFADPVCFANRNLLAASFANHSSDAVVFNSLLLLAYPASGAVVDGACLWLANESSNAVVDYLRLWLAYVASYGARNLLGNWLAYGAANSVRNLLANRFAAVLGYRALLRVALRNPNATANRAIRTLAANLLARARAVAAATGARIR